MMVEAFTLLWKSHMDVSLKCYTLLPTPWVKKGRISGQCIFAGLQPHQGYRCVGTAHTTGIL